MPSLHCHLPPEEEEKVLEQDDVIDLGEEVAAPSETDEQEMDDNPSVTRSDDGEEENDSTDHAIDDTSSEASSMLNDPTIQRWVPVVSSSSDENESEGGGFWTPPSTLGDDIEDINAVSGIRQGFLRRNTARRSRGRRPGVFYVRRGRHRQPLNEQEWYRLSPFERGLTFNGFARNLEPETVTGHMVEDYPRDILYKVKWRNMREAKFIEASVMRTYKPEMVVDYWEANIRRSS
ncbi:uncharacterized protein LOC132935813 [Metopolophium dirhodum]|uniref:uncharacterized protein LOC132935813 n=1 Tax=Metopolophium dirhodum TaxID=44670 RepID=UPI0029902E25|nr:uncharacterized protein LOC132935813 [Metopolophium dirhodum]